VLHLARSWDDEGEQDSAKTVAGTRTVGIVPTLRPHLVAHKLATGRGGSDLVFGRTADTAMVRTTIRSRAQRAWKAAGLASMTPHECRHTFASMMLAAGVDRGEVMRQMGHAGTAVLDRYTDVIDGSVAEAARRLQTYLDANAEKATG
jgi:integrase